MAIVAGLGSISSIHALGFWQAQDSINSGNAKLLTAFIVIAALALLGQFFAFVFMAIGAAKTQKRITAILEEFQVKAVPVIERSQVFFDEVAPKIREITNNLHDITTTVRTKVHELEPSVDAMRGTVDEANARTRAQIGRVDGMVTSVLNATAEIGVIIHHGVRGPVREMAAIITGVKAGLETLVSRFAGMRPAAPAASARETERESVYAGIEPDRRDMGL